MLKTKKDLTFTQKYGIIYIIGIGLAVFLYQFKPVSRVGESNRYSYANLNAGFSFGEDMAFKKGHIPWNKGKKFVTVDEAKRQKQQWYQDNKEKVKQQHQSNKEEIARRMKKWRENNKERISDYSKEYNKKHPNRKCNRTPNRICITCGNTFYRSPSHIRKGWGKYCKDCSAQKLIKRTCKGCGDKFDAYAGQNEKFCTKECYWRYRKGRYNVGSLNPLWKGGISKNPEHRNKQCRERRHRKGISKRYLAKFGGPKPMPLKYYRQRRRALMKIAGHLSLKTIEIIYKENEKKFGELTCIYCLMTLKFSEATLEHIVPVSRGGTNEQENLAIACIHCNSSKGNKTIKEWKGVLKS